ncbi:AraC family transcriptional regulator [Pararhizobium sp. BT-229]|uniref:AraC family transcriptional regulator n=1 Tax=Pararhizobium sp. BT-229 TaxID=2986923 RepID=UPI0021F6AE04|nr:AraC family transcriptional regulator [Pararhizobium sp. BT-229]MCV9965788.1 AraC family transcriptional regulator [Pararhizobium sp. BT-229]
MNANSTLGNRALEASGSSIACAGSGDLERSCTSTVTDSIKVAPVSAGIERIEAHFHGDAFEPHRHDTYALGLTLQGVQAFRYRGMVRYSQPGNVIVLHPDEVHDGGAGTDEGLRYRMMYLPPEMLIGALGEKQRGLPFVPSPVIADRAFAASLAEAMRDLDGAIDDLHLDDVLTGIADALVRHGDSGRHPNRKYDQAAIRRACDFLQAHSDRLVTSEDLEKVSGLDRFTLARQFRSSLGTSPHRYLIMRRLERARAMIGSGRSLVDIALETGFSDQAHFTRHFKKASGMTPGRWANLSGRA